MYRFDDELEPVVINISLGTEETYRENQWESTMNGNASNYSVNLSDGDINLMKRVYGVRFMPYTVLCILGICFNILSLIALCNIRGSRTVHHTLLMNLACCDIIGSPMLWMYYNSPMIFPRFALTGLNHCLFIVMVLVAPFILSLSASVLALLSLALNQYIAICDPLFATTTVTKRKACIVIMIIWILASTAALMPGILMLVRTRYTHCAMYVGVLGVRSLEICAYGLATLILIIIVLYALIYREVVRYRRRTPQLTRTRGRDETENSYKAFITTLLLAGTLVIFWLPFMAYTFLSAHIDVTTVPEIVFYIKMYAIDFLPMLNFLTDPLIYGIRMREIRDSFHRIFAKIFPCCIKGPIRVNVRSSIRFTSLDTTTTL